MPLSVFFELVEIRTKLASILPFAIGTLFAVTYFHTFNAVNTILFFMAMLLFDMMTTALNNLMDYRKAKDAHYQTTTNVIGRANLAPKLVEKNDYRYADCRLIDRLGAGLADRLATIIDGHGLFCHWHFVYMGTVTVVTAAAW